MKPETTSVRLWRQVLILSIFQIHILRGVSSFIFSTGRHGVGRLQHSIETKRQRPLVTLAATSTNVTSPHSTTTTSSSSSSGYSCLTANLDPEIYGAKWLVRVEELHRFQTQYGHCLVPKRHKDNPTLGNWVNKQRQSYRKFNEGRPSSMTEERIKLLDRLGFIWDASDVNTGKCESDQYKIIRQSRLNAAWQKRFDELKEYMKLHGTSHVPSASTLGQWVSIQRGEYERRNGGHASRLTDERFEALNSIGFEWRGRYSYLWDVRIEQLRQYKAKYGDCAVPITYADNPSLAHWVSLQRKRYNKLKAGKATSLTQERIKQLERLGFVWNRWEYEFQKRDNTRNDKE